MQTRDSTIAEYLNAEFSKDDVFELSKNEFDLILDRAFSGSAVDASIVKKVVSSKLEWHSEDETEHEKTSPGTFKVSEECYNCGELGVLIPNEGQSVECPGCNGHGKVYKINYNKGG